MDQPPARSGDRERWLSSIDGDGQAKVAMKSGHSSSPSIAQTFGETGDVPAADAPTEALNECR